MTPFKNLVRYLRKVNALMEILNEDVAKIKVISNALFGADKVKFEFLEELSEGEHTKVFGSRIGKKVPEFINSGGIEEYSTYFNTVPSGVQDLLNVKGLGGKKVRALWLEGGIDSLDALRISVNSGQLKDIKGFGEKLQESIKDFFVQFDRTKGFVRYAKAKEFGNQLLNDLEISEAVEVGAYGRKENIINKLSFLFSEDFKNRIDNHLEHKGDFKIDYSQSGPFHIEAEWLPKGIKVEFLFSPKEQIAKAELLLQAHPDHLNKVVEGDHFRNKIKSSNSNSVEQLYKEANLPFIPNILRQGWKEWEFLDAYSVEDLVKPEDIKGLVHNHSTWSDGMHSIEEMSQQCISLGMQYLGMADHSKSAFYANGLDEDRVAAQQREIEGLNTGFQQDFKIFKGIESDILNDGSLDYADEILASFDYVVASVHSILNMDIVKATDRLLKAVENPYTTILGHPSGRLLLDREGYPYDVEAILQACKEHNVAIELNASPYRLDLDWKYLWRAQELGVLISINPDAHERKGLSDYNFGVIEAQRGAILKKSILNVKSLTDFQQWLAARKS